ncbi:MAG TPA: lytic transglycosylase domain-containing protein [Thermodesulfobacteriota bacterium]|nr:lytic transglycosylase domain-containing protein [Thermodesulfobacteriota bacterium]
MESIEGLIRTEHPPHGTADKRNGHLKAPGWAKIESIPETTHPKKKSLSILGIFPKLVLITVAFILSFHFPNFAPDLSQKEQTIMWILEVLERQPTGLANVTKEELAEVIYEEATRYNHDPKFILALIFTESEFYNWAVSQKGAKGLMQIMPYVAESLARDLGIEWSGDRTLFNPYLNIRIGIYYLSQLMLDFKDVGTALTAYNYGPTYVRSLIERKQQIPHDYYRRFLTAYKSI